MSETLPITRPDDWHLHLRDGPLLAGVVGHSAERFARALVMPNLWPPVADFEAAKALDRLEAFASFHGADFYRLPRSRDQIRLRREAWKVPEYYGLGDAEIVPLFAGRELSWRLVVD